MRRDEDDESIARLADARRRSAGFRAAARRALGFARLYREEEGGPGGSRERACVDQALAFRRAAHAAAMAPAAEPRPGLARTSADPAASDRKTG